MALKKVVTKTIYNNDTKYNRRIDLFPHHAIESNSMIINNIFFI